MAAFPFGEITCDLSDCQRGARNEPAGSTQACSNPQEESGLSWSEIARRLETYRHTVWRWAEGRTRPNHQHRKALVELADSLGLGHLLAD